MTTRQSSRSASIPIPSASRNIESAIQMPFSLSPTRPRVTSASSSRLGTSGDDHRSLGVSYGVRGSSSVAPITTSPTRPTARSMGTAGGFGGRVPSRISVSGSFEPRVIRGDTSRSPDAACHPASTSPARTRRTSGNGRGGGRTPSTQRALHSHSLVPPSPTSNPVFSRPAYLEHSALRHLLQTEATPPLPLSRKMEAAQQESHQGLRRYATASSNADSDDESSVTPPPRDIPPSPSSTLPSQDQMLQLPTRWSEQYRHHLLTVSPDGRDLSYHGASCHGDRDAAAARTNHPIPPACGIYYYEVEIVNKGQQGHISIGFAGRDVKTSRLPGWEPFSWGYHGDDGHSFAAEKSGAGTPYGPTFGTGDVIGCGIDFTTHKAFFTKNSVFIGPVFDNIGKDIEIYPSIGLRHQGESVRVNFGHEPFKFDIDYHVQQQRDAAWGKIMGTSLDTEFLNKTFLGPESKPSESHLTKSLQTDGQTKEAINKLVISYLEHHGYGKTLRAFQKQQSSNAAAVAAVSTSDRDVQMDDGLASEDAPTLAESNMEHRTKIVQAVLSGDIDSAIEDTQRYYPAVLASEEGLMLFKLRCRKFVELLLGAAELKKKMRTRSVSRTRTPTSSVMPVTTHEEAVAEEMDGILEDGVEDVKPPSHVHGAPPGFTVPTSSGMDVDEDGSDAAAVAAAVVPSGSGTPRTPTPASSTNGFNTPTTSAAPRGIGRRRSSNSHPGPITDFRHGLAAKTATKAQYEAALNEAIIYGQTLSKEYQGDSRSEVKQLFKRTAGIVAFDDPMNAAPATGVQEIVGWEAKHGLAMELNRAILRSLGQPTTPKLETVYRHTAVCISQLGLMGVGSAAFADMGKELLEA